MPYVGKSPSNGVRNRFYFTASGGETSLSGADDNSKTLTFSDAAYVDVILNGNTLVSGTDYTAVNNTISSFSPALDSDDVVEIVAYDIFSVADTVSASSGGTFNGNVTMSKLTADSGVFNDAVTITEGVLIKGAAPSTNNSGKLSYNTTSGVMEFSAHSTGGDTKINFITSDSGSQSTNLHIAHDGGVGVGTTSPSNAKLHVYNTSTNYARIGTTTKGHYFESQSDSATDGFEIYQQHGSNTSRNSFIVNDNRTGSKSAAFAIRGDGAISTPSQPIGWRRNTNTTNGWVTMTSSQHYIWSSWYTTGNSWYGDSKADTIADNGRFTATHAGWYLVGHEGYISTGSSGQTAKYTYAYVYKNGSAHYSDGRIMGYGGDYNDKFYQNTNPVYLDAGDYIQCGLYNVGNGAQYYSPYCGYWVYYLG